MKPIFLVDVDGVILKWQEYAVPFCQENGMDTTLAKKLLGRDLYINPFTKDDGTECVESIHKYNKQWFMKCLPAYSDAFNFIFENKHRFNFIAVTAMSNDPEDIARRIYNLNDLFGEGTFSEVYGCGIRESKGDLFIEIGDRYGLENIVGFVDDLADHLVTASTRLPHTKLYHLVRDVRKPCKVDCEVISSLSQIDLEV